MDGVSNGKPFFEMIWGENPLFSETSLYIWVVKKNPPLSTQPGTWILQNAALPFFSPLRAKFEAGPAKHWLQCVGGPSWGSIRPTASRPLELSMKTEVMRGVLGLGSLGHRFPRAKFQWMKCTFFQSWFTVYRWFCLWHLKISINVNDKSSQIKIY